MKPKIYLLLILIIASFTYADQCEPQYLKDNTLSYWKMEESGFPFTDDVSSSNYATGNFGTAAVAGIINNSIDIDIGDGIRTFNQSNFELNDFTYMFWLNRDATSGQNSFPGSFYDINVNEFGWFISIGRTGGGSPNQIAFQARDGLGGSENYVTDETVNVSTWQHVTITWDGTDATACVDSNCDGVRTGGITSIGYQNNNMSLALGGRYDNSFSGTSADAKYDEIAFFNVTLNQTCIDYMYANGAPTTSQQYDYGASPSNTSTVSILFPADGERFTDYNGSIVLTSTNPTVSMSCALNNTGWPLQNTQPNVTLNYLNSSAPNIPDLTYIINYTCNFTNGQNETGLINFTVDTTLPTIMLNSPANNSLLNTNFTLNVTYFDKFLFRTNTTITRLSDNVSVFNDFSGNLTGNDMYYNVTAFIDISNGSYTDGNYSIFMDAADTHTRAEFKEQLKERRRNLENRRRALDIELKRGKQFTIDYEQDVELTTHRSKDRMHFNHRSNDRGIVTMFIEAEKVTYLPDSPFPGHFIINDEYWFDVEGLPEIRVNQVGNNRWRIRYRQDRELLTSNSLGGLNQQNATSFFTLDTSPPLLLSNVTTSFGTKATIFINATENFNYNFTTYAGVCSSFSNTTVDTGSSAGIGNPQVLTTLGLQSNTSYVSLVTLTDQASNFDTYCFNFTTSTFDIELDLARISLPSNQIDMQCRAVDSEARNVTYGYQLYRNGTVVDYNNYEAGSPQATEVSFNTGVSGNFSKLTDGNLTEIALFFTNVNSSIVVNLSKPVVSDNLEELSFLFRMENSFADFRVPEISCLSTINDEDSAQLVAVLDEKPSTATDYRVNVTNTGCLNVDKEIIQIKVNLTNSSAGANTFAGLEQYEWYDFTFKFDSNTTHNVTTTVASFPSPQNGNYTLTCHAYNGNNFAQPLNSTSVQIPSIFFNVYDEETGNPITAPVTITFISDDPSVNQNVNRTFSGGSLSVDFLQVIDYNMLFVSDNYTQRHYLLEAGDVILNGTFNLFLLKSDVSGFSILRVIDQSLDPVSDATVRVRKNIPNFATKQTLTLLRSNFEGESTFDFKRHTDNYQFVVDYQGNTVLTSSETQVSKEIVKIQIPLFVDELLSAKIYSSATGNVSIINGTISDKICRYSYYAENTKEGCVRLYERTLTNNDMLICESCSSNTLDVLTCNFNVTNSTLYLCQGWIDTNTSSSFIMQAQATLSPATARNIYGVLGLILSLMMILVFGYMGRESAALTIFFATLGLVLSVLVSFISIPFGGLALIIIVAGFFMFKVRS